MLVATIGIFSGLAFIRCHRLEATIRIPPLPPTNFADLLRVPVSTVHHSVVLPRRGK
jgi:hypothetical protein